MAFHFFASFFIFILLHFAYFSFWGGWRSRFTFLSFISFFFFINVLTRFYGAEFKELREAVAEDEEGAGAGTRAREGGCCCSGIARPAFVDGYVSVVFLLYLILNVVSRILAREPDRLWEPRRGRVMADIAAAAGTGMRWATR